MSSRLFWRLHKHSLVVAMRNHNGSSRFRLIVVPFRMIQGFSGKGLIDNGIKASKSITFLILALTSYATPASQYL